MLNKRGMLDPITATLAAGAGSRLVDTVANTAAALTDKLAAPLKVDKTASFEQTVRQGGMDRLRKLFAAFPGLKAQLGEGPYWVLTNKDGTVQLSSQTTGNKVTIDGSTKAGAEFVSYYQSLAALSVKKHGKGLEFPIV